MILSTDDAAQFFRLMWGLQFYVNRQLKILSGVADVEAYARWPIKEKIAVRDALWKNPSLIDSYIQANPDSLSPEELEIVGKWRAFVADTFYVMRYLKRFTIFLGGSKVYAVLGLFDRFDDMFAGRPLPIMLETVLLPFKGSIVYDGSCRIQSIVFGGGIRSSFEETYRTAKQEGQIITSLEPGAAAAKPIQQHRELDEKTRAAVTQIGEMSERLRGSTPVQSTALGLLRASAKAAQAAVNNPDDLAELKRAERQVRTAAKQLQNLLERAEW